MSPDVVNALAVSPDGSLLVAGHAPVISLLSLTGRTPDKDLEVNIELSNQTQLGFSPDGMTVVLTGFDTSITLWDFAADKLKKEPAVDYVADMTLTQGDEFATAGGQAVRLWSWRTGNALGVLRLTDLDSDDTLTSVKYSPVTRLAVLATRHKIHLWDAAKDQWIKLREVDIPARPDRMAFDPTGKLIAVTVGSGQVAIVEAATGAILTNFQITQDADPYIMQIAFSPDGRLLAISGKTGDIELWGIPGTE
jgi:WD40 repeat protein